MTVVYGAVAGTDQVEKPIHLPKRDVGRAMRFGALGLCPKCGTGKLFRSYTAVNAECPSCGEEMSHQRADDLPAYVTMLITGHVVVPLMVLVERAYRPEIWVHMSLWLPLTLILSLGLLRPIKGAIIGLQWALYMHGFNPYNGDDKPVPDPAGALRNDASGR